MNTNHWIVNKVLQVQDPTAIRLGLDRIEEDKLRLNCSSTFLYNNGSALQI